LREHRHLGVEAPHVRVEQVVFVVAAEVGDRACDARLFLGDDVAPDLAVRQLLRALDRAIGMMLSPEWMKKSGRSLRMVA